jgi:hypothetical protein
LCAEAHKTIENDFNSVETKKKRSQNYETAVKLLINGLREIKNVAFEAAENVGISASRCRQGRLGDKEQEKVLKELDSVNKTITESAVKEIAGFLFPETEGWEEEIDSENQSPHIKHLEFSARFYKALCEAAEYNLDYLEKH